MDLNSTFVPAGNKVTKPLDTRNMSQTETQDDSVLLEREKKFNKSKNSETYNLQDINNGDSCLNATGDFSKDNKLKPVLNEDGDEVEKGKKNDGNLAKKVKKKRKNEITENESKSKFKSETVSFSSDVETFGGGCLNAGGDFPKDEDGNLAKNDKKNRKHEATENGSKLKVKPEKVCFSSQVETSGDSCLNATGGFTKDDKLKSVLDEDDDEGEKGKGNDDNLAKNVKKNRKHKITENESKSKVKSEKVNISSHAETYGDSCLNAAGDLSKDDKLKSVLNEDEVKKDNGNDDNLAKKVKKKRKHDVTENESNSKVKSKKVCFSSHVETFPSSNTQNEKSKIEEDNLVRGKRFTPEEDEIVKDAVLHYIKLHVLGEEGLNMVLNCHAYPEIKNCWKEIGTCIPYRPYTAIYYRAHILFERSENRKWTKEETEFLQECYEKHGNDWKMVAKELGKNRVHVKDKWRRIKLSTKKGGKWSQEEYQNLYDLVNLDLQMKVVSQEKRSKHGMLRDDIPWGAISDKLATRSDSTCCQKWYRQLTSSLVAEDKWSNADDYRLIKALYDLDAACVEDVDWDRVLEHRPGDICRKRWDQMVMHIGHRGSQPFSEQVEILSQRYCPDLAETREAWDSKPST